MPLYSYRCPTGHAQTLLIKSADRTDTVPCDVCDQPANYTITPPARGIVQGSSTPIRETATSREGFTTVHESPTFVIREKGTSLTRMDYECFVCRQRFGDDYTTVPETHPPCPQCGSATHPVIVGVADVDWFTKDHPHGWFDPGLGVFVANRAEWRAEMKRQGVVECDWTSGMEAQRRNDAEQAAREDEEVRRMLHDYKHGPDAAAMERIAGREGMDWRPFAKDLGVE